MNFARSPDAGGEDARCVANIRAAVDDGVPGTSQPPKSFRQGQFENCPGVDRPSELLARTYDYWIAPGQHDSSHPRLIAESLDPHAPRDLLRSKQVLGLNDAAEALQS
jgi:hypothetical protein